MERGQECYRTCNWEMLQAGFKLALPICALITRPPLSYFKNCVFHSGVQCSAKPGLHCDRRLLHRSESPALPQKPRGAPGLGRSVASNGPPSERKTCGHTGGSQRKGERLHSCFTTPIYWWLPLPDFVFLITVLRHAIKELNAIPIILQL